MTRQSSRVCGCSAGDGGDQRADAGGDADGSGEDVVDHERGGGEQAGAIAEVFAGDGEGTAAVGIGFDGLANRRNRG